MIRIWIGKWCQDRCISDIIRLPIERCVSFDQWMIGDTIVEVMIATQCSSSNIEWLPYPELGDDECSTNIDARHLRWSHRLQDALAIVLHTNARVSCNRYSVYIMICSEHHDLMFAIILIHEAMTIDTYRVNRKVPYDWHDILQSFWMWHRRANLVFYRFAHTFKNTWESIF